MSSKEIKVIYARINEELGNISTIINEVAGNC